MYRSNQLHFMKFFLGLLLFAIILMGCHNNRSSVPIVGFIDAFEDNTLKQAKQGFLDALQQNGFDEQKGTIQLIYRNAQGDIPALTQIVNYMVAQNVTLIGTCPSLSTITALQLNKKIPVFMTVSPTPSLMKLTDEKGNPPANLFGVGEEIDYIDSSFMLMPELVSKKGDRLSVGMIYNQAEPQSVEAITRIKTLAAAGNIDLVYESISSSADARLVTQSVLAKNVDVFFANPDNTVFAAFETIVNACEKSNVPIFTSEAGLVSRGAVAAYGADMYQWGFQAGLQAAKYLKTGSSKDLKWEKVKDRIHVYNPAMAKKYNIAIPGNFKAIP